MTERDPMREIIAHWRKVAGQSESAIFKVLLR